MTNVVEIFLSKDYIKPFLIYIYIYILWTLNFYFKYDLQFNMIQIKKKKVLTKFLHFIINE